MKSVMFSSLIGVTLAIGLLCFLFPGPPPVDYEVTDNYIYGVGVGNDKQAAYDNARAGIVEAVREEGIETSFASENSVTGADLVEAKRIGLFSNKVKIKVRVPIMFVSEF